MGKRLGELCSTLSVSDELRLKIWTCFEYSLVHCTDLMVDRHLDQLLMCAIYIMAKVGCDRSLLSFVHLVNTLVEYTGRCKDVCIKRILLLEVKKLTCY